MKLAKFIFILFLFNPLNRAVAGSSDVLEILLKSAIPAFTLSPFSFSTSKLSIGGFVNFGGESTGDYANDVKKAETGYGGLVAYEFPQFEAEGFSKKLAFHKNTDVEGSEQNTYSQAHVYGIGVRYTNISKLFNLKIGYLFLDIENKNVVSNNGDLGISEQKDNGFYYGLGFRFKFGEAFALYIDGTGYFLKEERIHLVDSELGLRISF